MRPWQVVGLVAIVIVAGVLFVALVLPVRTETSASPTPVVRASPLATLTVTTAVPTSAASTPFPAATGLYVNSTYKFSMTLPPPYRSSTRALVGSVTPQRGQVAFTARTDAEEAAIDTSGCHTACPLWQYAAYVIVNTGTGTQTPREYYTKEVGGTTSQKIEDTLVDGRTAISVTNGAVYPMQFIIKDGDRIFLIGYRLYGPENGMPVPAGASKEKLDAILASFKFLP
jgi:hypothetical protein